MTRKRYGRRTPLSQLHKAPPIWRPSLIPLASIWMIGAALLMGVYVNPTHVLKVDFPSGLGLLDEEPRPPYIRIEIMKSGSVLMEGREVILEDLPNAILSRDMDWPIVLVAADPDAPYPIVLKTLGEVVNAGVRPSDICFDDLSEFRYYRRESIGYSGSFDPSKLLDAHWQKTFDIAPSGCEQFVARSSYLII